MNYSINLDITPGGMPPILHMSQYDTGRFYTVNLKSDGVDFTPGLGTTGVVKGVNGKGVAFAIPVTVSGSTATFQLTPASTDQFGKIAVTLELTIGSNVLSPLAMIFDVQRAGYTNEEAVRSPEFETAIQEAIASQAGFCPIIVNITDAAATITPEANRIYHCGTLTSLEITDGFATVGDWVVEFDTVPTGSSVSTSVTLPSALKLQDAVTFQKGYHYEINARNGYAIIADWNNE